MMSKTFILTAGVMLALCLFLTSCTESVIYVDNSGNDRNSGSSSHPVATLQKALDLSRNSKVRKIVIAEGNYYDVSVTLTDKDSGLKISGEAGKKVRLYGGRFFGKWEQKGKWLEAQIPDSLWPALDFRILIINDSLRQRARLPETGAFRHKSEWPYLWQSSQGGWSKKPTEEELTTLIYDPADIGSWLDTRNAELTVFHAWDDSYVALSGIDTIKHSLKFANAATHPAGAFASWAGEKTHQYIVWNIKQGMTKPGQWFVDRTHRKLVYWPFSFENAASLNAMIPTKSHIIQIDKIASGISMENLEFSCSGAPVCNTGYATANITGAIVADQVSNLSLKNIQVKKVAGWAVKLTGTGISVSDCEFSETGAGGISYNGNHIRIERCGIHDLGKLYFGAVGIMGDGDNNLISHCELYNIPYCAINGIGSKSVAEFNLIYNFKQMMVDGGAIYTGGVDSMIYRNNAVICRKGNTIEGWTYYFDELAKNCIMENNLAVNTRVPVHHHMANDLLMRNNIFIDEGLQTISYPLCSNLNFSGNTFIAKEVRFSGPNGEKGSTKKESLNAVFQRYFDCTGISSFEGNKLFANSVSHDILHVYGTVRKDEFLPGKNQIIQDKGAENAVFQKLPEQFSETGYRNNFSNIYKTMTGSSN
jgi:hypothetical protein